MQRGIPGRRNHRHTNRSLKGRGTGSAAQRGSVDLSRSAVDYCGAKLRRSDCTIDHLRPVSRGGKSTWSYTACACAACNGRKADRWPHEAGMDLLWEPKRPRWDYIRISGEVPVEWRAYLPG